jgi:hypothetical protein
MLGCAAAADAQENNRFAIGVSYSHRLANDESARGHRGVGIKWRLGHSKTGWDKEFGLGWFSTDVDRKIGGRSVSFGELKIRPIVAGYGYTHSISPKWHVKGDVVGGVAFASLGLSDEADTAFRALDAGGASARVNRVIPVVRPEVSTWYDVHRKLGVGVSAGYTFARPNVTITSAGSRFSERLRADTFSVSAGIVYRIF